MAQDIRNGIDHEAVHIDVEDREFEIRLERQCHALFEVGGRADDQSSQIAYHVFDQHRHHGLVFDDEHAGLSLILHGHPLDGPHLLSVSLHVSPTGLNG